jgi:hypothetical protein
MTLVSVFARVVAREGMLVFRRATRALELRRSLPLLEAPRIIAARDTPAFRVELRSDGLLAYHAVPGLVLTYPIALQVLEVGLTIVDAPKPTMVLMQDMARVERDARAFFASEEYMRLCSQTALVVGSPVSRVIGNFFVGLNRPKYPHRIFDDPERAVRWLRSFVQ